MASYIVLPELEEDHVEVKGINSKRSSVGRHARSRHYARVFFFPLKADYRHSEGGSGPGGNSHLDHFHAAPGHSPRGSGPGGNSHLDNFHAAPGHSLGGSGPGGTSHLDNFHASPAVNTTRPIITGNNACCSLSLALSVHSVNNE